LAETAPGQTARLEKETESCVKAISRLQRAVSDVSAAMESKGQKAEEA